MGLGSVGESRARAVRLTATPSGAVHRIGGVDIAPHLLTVVTAPLLHTAMCASSTPVVEDRDVVHCMVDGYKAAAQ